MSKHKILEKMTLTRRGFIKLSVGGLAALLLGCSSEEERQEKAEQELLKYQTPIIISDESKSFQINPVDLSKTRGGFRGCYISIDCYDAKRRTPLWSCATALYHENKTGSYTIKNPMLAAQNKDLLVVSMDNYLCGLLKTNGQRVWPAHSDYRGDSGVKTVIANNKNGHDLQFNHAVTALTFTGEGTILEVATGRNSKTQFYRFEPLTAHLINFR